MGKPNTPPLQYSNTPVKKGLLLAHDFCSTRIPQFKSERGANLEQLVLASARNFTSQITDSIFGI
jgi:hypothetical protein